MFPVHVPAELPKPPLDDAALRSALEEHYIETALGWRRWFRQGVAVVAAGLATAAFAGFLGSNWVLGALGFAVWLVLVPILFGFHSLFESYAKPRRLAPGRLSLWRLFLAFRKAEFAPGWHLPQRAGKYRRRRAQVFAASLIPRRGDLQSHDVQ